MNPVRLCLGQMGRGLRLMVPACIGISGGKSGKACLLRLVSSLPTTNCFIPTTSKRSKTPTRFVLLGPPPRDEPELEARAAITSTRIQQQVDFIIIVDGEELLENCLLCCLSNFELLPI
jgi:hypothetical protein